MSERYCPICRGGTTTSVCAIHRVPTVPLRLLEESRSDRLVPGRVLAGQFRIERLLGRGGMGCVYAATQLKLARQVALKTLHPQMVASPEQLTRFYQEARACTRLHEPHVVGVYDFGVDEGSGTPFMAMELLSGRTLRAEVAQNGPLPPRRAAGILAQVGKALMEARRRNVVHRDLKSENVMLVDTAAGDDFVKVMDFGIAKVIHGESPAVKPVTVTEHGPMGTPRTMAPEQILGQDVDFRTDLYALGCMLFELLTGHGPYTGEDRLAVMAGHLSQGPPPALPDECGAPPALRRLCERLLQTDPEDRPGSVRGVVTVLSAVAAGEPCNVPEALAVPDSSEHTTAGGQGCASSFGAAEPTGATESEHTRPGHALLAPASRDLDTLPPPGARPAPPRRRWAPLSFFVGSVVLAAGVTAAVLAARQAVPIDGMAAAPQDAGAPPAASGPALAAEPPAGVDPPAEVATPAPPRRDADLGARAARRAPDPLTESAAPRSYIVRSTPEARVYRAGRAVGVTPYEVRLAMDDLPVRLELRPLGRGALYGRKAVLVTPGDRQDRIVRLPRRLVGGGGEDLWPSHE